MDIENTIRDLRRDSIASRGGASNEYTTLGPIRETWYACASWCVERELPVTGENLRRAFQELSGLEEK